MMGLFPETYLIKVGLNQVPKGHAIMKYNNNLRLDGNKVISYTTHVATISGDKLLVHGYWSKTTSKHINLIAREYDLTKVDSPVEKSEPKEVSNPFGAVGFIAAIGSLMGADTQEASNKWKKRMLAAGMPLNFPPDWDTLSEDEKERRLDAVIKVTQEKL